AGIVELARLADLEGRAAEENHLMDAPFHASPPLGSFVKPKQTTDRPQLLGRCIAVRRLGTGTQARQKPLQVFGRGQLTGQKLGFHPLLPEHLGQLERPQLRAQLVTLDGGKAVELRPGKQEMLERPVEAAVEAKVHLVQAPAARPKNATELAEP